MKVLFTDYDGVLVKFSGPNKKMRPAIPDPANVRAFNVIVESTGAKVVVTSDWRKNASVEKLADCMRKWGCECDVVDKTPSRPDGRGMEIAEWLSSHDEVESFAVLDDDLPTPLPVHVAPRWIKVDPLLGLLGKEALAAVRLLSCLNPYLQDSSELVEPCSC
jgi:HAD domain in Swiss Army Knife RNA repair proteins